ncbi:cytochrome P450 [Sphingomonas sp.]|uniref:cytochrome P450 n=1 Tax=Sphingomonas sp. TaxID=28214 RepID=UPI002ED7752A
MSSDAIGRAPLAPSLPRLGLADTCGVLAGVVAPNFAKGPIIRRPWMVALAERLDLDRRAVRRLQRLRARHGSGPLMLRLPGRSQAVLLDPAHVRRVLDGSPEPFATASSEKRAALAHFQPEGVLISHGHARAQRRRLNEAALDTDRPCHRLASVFTQAVRREAEVLMSGADAEGTFGWHAFHDAWFAGVRRIVLGEGARNDRDLTEQLDRLRRDANWAFMKPRRTRLRRCFESRLRSHLARAEPDSIAGLLAGMATGRDAAPAGQVPQWLFAFDAAGIATLRALALLAAHPDALRRAADEAAAAEPVLPFLRACLLESVRLWPTTPMILRETTRDVAWDSAIMPKGTGILILVPFLQRDDERLPFANRFAPELWMDADAAERWMLAPFSAGPAVCPGRNLVLLLASHMLAALVQGGWTDAVGFRLDPDRPLPATLDHLKLRFGEARC